MLALTSCASSPKKEAPATSKADVYFPAFPDPGKTEIKLSGGKVIIDKTYWDKIVYYVYETELAIEKAGY